MNLILDQSTLRQAVIHHLQSVGVTANIKEVAFRYTRVPYTVFAEVTLADAPPAPVKVVREREVVVASFAEDSPQPIVDPDTLPIAEESTPDEPKPDGPAEPLFGGS